MHRCDPAELALIQQWVTADKANADWLFEMERVWGLKDEWRFSDSQEVANAYNSFLAAIRGNESESEQALYMAPSTNNRPPSEPVATRRPAARTAIRYVAAAVVAVLLAVNLYHMLHKEAPDAGVNTIEVARGQRTALTLSDGTRVWLNSQSRLTYPAVFTAGNREVTLTGEGFFEVAHNSRKPFIVHVPLMNIRVLGTRFDVKSYPGETALVTLTEGEVEVATADAMSRVRMKPNQQVACSEETGLRLSKKVDADLVGSWVSGELYFVDQPLSAIAADLERRFDVQFEIRDRALAEDLFTCHFKETVSIEQILFFLKETKQLDYRINGQQIQILPVQRP